VQHSSGYALDKQNFLNILSSEENVNEPSSPRAQNNNRSSNISILNK